MIRWLKRLWHDKWCDYHHRVWSDCLEAGWKECEPMAEWHLAKFCYHLWQYNKNGGK